MNSAFKKAALVFIVILVFLARENDEPVVFLPSKPSYEPPLFAIEPAAPVVEKKPSARPKIEKTEKRAPPPLESGLSFFPELIPPPVIVAPPPAASSPVRMAAPIAGHDTHLLAFTRKDAAVFEGLSSFSSTVQEMQSGSILRPENLVKLEAYVDEKPAGTLGVYSHHSGVYFSVEDVARLLDLPATIAPENRIVQIKLGSTDLLTIDFQKGQFQRHSKTEALQAGDYLLQGNAYFLSQSFLNAQFPLEITAQLAAAKLHIHRKDTAPIATGPDMPAPSAAPTTAVAKQDLNFVGPPLPPEEAGNKPEEEKRMGSAEGDPLILQPRIKHNPPSDLFIEAMQMEDRVYLPLDDMCKLLEFGIRVKDEEGTASGTLLNEDHPFDLDYKKGQVQLGGKTLSFDKNAVVMKDKKIYVEAKAFEEWFGIATKVDFQQMYLQLTTAQELPSEKRAQRHVKWKKLLSAADVKEKDLPLVENPMQMASIPAFDVDLESTMQSGPQGLNADFHYMIIGAGDLGYLTSNTYLAGNASDGTPSNFRINFGRTQMAPELLGVMQARSYQFGDITTPGYDMVMSSNLGRGFVVTNQLDSSSGNFDTRNFTGDATPGWEAELYRNNTLLGFQT
ncbi:MAG TPA: hypothetical protein VHB73_03080, partial [Alphaproteobacteria bacterium]|nr:hypothetical protein [Alphaproteobacteria bacterium]